MNNYPINRKIKSVRYESYYSNGVLLAPMIAIYLEFDDGLWYKITVCDGKSSFELCDEPFLTNDSDNEKNEFYFPIKVLSTIDLTQYGKLTEIEEYLWGGQDDESCGLKLKFDNGAGLRIIDNDDLLLINSYEDRHLIENCIKKNFVNR